VASDALTYGRTIRHCRAVIVVLAPSQNARAAVERTRRILEPVAHSFVKILFHRSRAIPRNDCTTCTDAWTTSPEQPPPPFGGEVVWGRGYITFQVAVRACRRPEFYTPLTIQPSVAMTTRCSGRSVLSLLIQRKVERWLLNAGSWERVNGQLRGASGEG